MDQTRFDAAGHYNRRDISSLRVDRSNRPQVSFDEPEAGERIPEILER